MTANTLRLNIATGIGGSGWPLGLLFASLVLSLPLIIVFTSFALPGGEVWQHLYTTVLGEYISNSLLMMCGVGALTLVLGIAPAWLVTMYRFRFSRILEWVLLLPMSMPAYIIAYTYTGMLDYAGPVQSWIRTFTGLGFGEYWFPEVRSLGGAITMLSLVLYPYVYLLTRAAFLAQSFCVLEVCRTLGCNQLQAFYKIALPLARPAIIIGVSLVLMETLADYGTVQYFGISTFTTGIFRTWFSLGSTTAAAQLSGVLMLFISALLILEYWSRRQQRFHHTTTRYSQINRTSIQGWRALLVIIICVFPVVLGFFLPAGYLIFLSLQTYSAVIDAEFITLVVNSIGLAITASLLALFLALFMAYGKRHHANSLTRFAVNLAGMGYAVPGTVIAVGVLIPFGWLDNTIDTWLRTHFNISSGLIFSGTLITLLFAYMVRFLAISLRTVDAGLDKVKPSMDEAGRSMGFGQISLIKWIHVPIIKGNVLTAILLVFVDVLKELPATLILRPFNFNTLAVRSFELANEERLADAACPALAIVLIGILPVIYLSRSISISRPGHEQYH